MKPGWKTIAIGRHLVAVPESAALIPQWKFNGVPILFRDDIRTDVEYDDMVTERERALRAVKHERYGSLFVERVPHANWGVTLVSWNRPGGTIMYRFDTYFRIGSQTMVYAGEVATRIRDSALSACDELSRKWQEIAPGSIPEGKGFVAGQTILVDTDFNPESWSLAIRPKDKPDVALRITCYARSVDRPGLRERAGGLLTSLLGTIVGMHQLRNRARPVGPIQADEILVAGTEKGKRLHAFKWEAPGKADALSEPNINVSMNVLESAYKTNQESFANDDEALELWDALVESIRLRQGAA